MTGLNVPAAEDFHKKEVSAVLAELGSCAAGLPQAEADLRLAKYGQNSLLEKPARGALAMFFDQFRDFMIMVLVAAALVSGAIGEFVDTAIILAIVILNAVMGFIQEHRAQKAMEALKKMAAPCASVLRGGSVCMVQARALVPGDVVLLDAGSLVPADLRLIEAASLKTEEAALTGESLSVEKHTLAIPEEGLPLGDRRNMAYSGTAVSYGRGRGVVTATGMKTELGKIAGMLQDEEEVQTPLQKRLEAFGKRLAWACLGICAAFFAFGLLRGEPAALMFLTSVSLAVAAIPEALPAVMSIALALGAGRMVKQNALIRKLLAVETLGSITHICSDKTGTLTQNRMTVEEVWLSGEAFKPGAPPEALRPLYSALLKAGALNNDSRKGPAGWTGDPTETALCALAADGGLEKAALDGEFPRLGELPFDSERKQMSTFHAGALDGAAGKYFSVTKGAAENLLENSGGLSQADKERVRRAAEEMASRGLRVLGLAWRRWDWLPAAPAPREAEKDLTFLGLVGIDDPPREEAAGAVAECGRAGIIPIMITGDHPVTARNIAERLGIMKPGDEGAVLTGRQLDELGPEEFAGRVDQVRVYARVAPEQKLRIVKTLQARGYYAAMTGDGVNDAPALKRADIGVAMGITGTDVSKEAAHMILLDDNFATIVRAVREGRRIYDNIRRFVRYVLSCNSGEICAIALAPFLGLPIPLLPIQILWINLVTDGLPGLALASEPEERDIMSRPPRKPGESLFSGGLGAHVVWVGLLMGGVCLAAQGWGILTGRAHWQTIVFTVLCLSQLGQAMAIRSESRSLLELGLLTNRPLLYSVALTVALQMLVIYVPGLNSLFHTAPLSLAELLLTLALSSVVFFAVEGEKFFRRRRQA